MKKDIYKILEELHYQTAKQLLYKIESGKATAKDYSAAIQLLKHNGIQVSLDDLEQNVIKIDDKTRELFKQKPSDKDYIAK